MRQAGRILPEYRKVRGSVSGFKELVQTPELACEVTLQPVDILGVDAAIIFSDILVVPEAMGLSYELIESKGPLFPKTIEDGKDVENIRVAEGPELQYVYDAIKLVKRELNNRIPLIGFSGAPWTLLSYMVEGQGSKTFSKARKFLYQQPEAAHSLLDKIADSTINYLKLQVEAGADILQVFDSWAGVLSAEQYRVFGIPYLEKICNAIDEVPLIIFPKGANYSFEELKGLSANVVSLDWNASAEDVRVLQSAGKAVQGNFDPAGLYASKDEIVKNTKAMLASFGPKGHIANLGHGVYPDTPLDNVKCFIDTVKEFRF
jgi:uroporphyrinogen decarboxylase